jgi:hypothetical protein
VGTFKGVVARPIGSTCRERFITVLITPESVRGLEIAYQV